MDKASHITTDHDTIMDWVEARGGFPAFAMSAGIEGNKLLRIGFEDEKNLEPIGWEQFFEEFENLSLAFLYQIDTEDGDESHFNTFVDRKEHEDEIEKVDEEDALFEGEYDDADDALFLGATDDDDDEDAF